MSLFGDFCCPARALIVAAAIAIVLMFLQAAESVVAPLLVAVFVAVPAIPIL